MDPELLQKIKNACALAMLAGTRVTLTTDELGQLLGEVDDLAADLKTARDALVLGGQKRAKLERLLAKAGGLLELFDANNPMNDEIDAALEGDA